MGNEFKLSVAAVAVDKAFKQSLGQGVLQVGREFQNLVTRGQEIINPDGAYFATPLEVKVNQNTGEQKIFWEGHDRSIEASLRRNAALLRLNKAPKEEYEKAKAEWKAWQQIEQKTLNLNEGEGIQFLALRQLNAADGVALQQVSIKNGKPLLESQLMPFDQVSQIESFQDQLKSRGEDISLSPLNSEVDATVAWAVQGQALNFKQDIPEMVDRVYQVENQTMPLTPQIEAISWQTLPEINDVDLSDTSMMSYQPANFTETPSLVRTTLGLVFETMTTSVVSTVSEPNEFIYEDSNPVEIDLTRQDSFSEVVEKPAFKSVSMPVGVEEKVFKGQENKSPAIIKTESKQRPLRKILKEESTKTVFGRKAVEATKPQFKNGSVKSKEKKIVDVTRSFNNASKTKGIKAVTRQSISTIISEKDISFASESSKGIDVIKIKPKEKVLKKVFKTRSIKHRRIGLETKLQRPKKKVVVFSATEPPIYKVPEWKMAPHFFNEDEIPVWQPTFTINSNGDEAMALLIVTTFILLSNTKWLRSGPVRGSGNSLVRTVFSVS